MIYEVGNPGPGLGQAQKCDMVKPVNRIPTLSPISKDNISYISFWILKYCIQYLKPVFVTFKPYLV
jgi:hypothetical protein